MKRLLLLFTIFVLGLSSAYSADWIDIKSKDPKPAKIKLISSNVENSKVNFLLEGFFMNELTTPNGKEFTISVENSSSMLIKGTPDLGKLTASVIIPDRAAMSVKLISSKYKDYTNINVAPSKGNLTRDIDPATIPYEYGEVYQQNKFYPENISELREPYIIRDYRGQTIIVHPFVYNPIKKTLRVYYDITVEIYKTDDNGLNTLNRKKELKTIDTEFKNLYKEQFLNFSNSKYTPVDEDGKMLIICYNDFIPTMQEFVNWKKQIGRETVMVDIETVGSSASAIKSYISTFYNANDLAYVLLIGDSEQIPSSYASGDSDNEYAYLVGSDHYPDIFIGRFSAQNTDQVQTQVQRTITYEKNPLTSFDWFTRNTGIASSQGTGDDGEYDYEHIRNMQTDLLGDTYTYCSELFDGNQGGNDASGDPTPAMVATEINAGSSSVLYCGHGSTTSWGTTGFSSTNVNALTNTGMLPFIWSVACVNGNFVGGSCFAEAWLRATDDNDQPTGAIATLMSTINQSWNPPQDGQDEMVDILVESYQDNIKRSFGGLSMNGCMHMNDEYGSQGSEITDTWVVFGDPSLMVRTAMPQTMNVTYNFNGNTQIIVNSSAQKGTVSLNVNNEIIGTGKINNGNATINFNPPGNTDIITLTVTAYNFLPYIEDVTIAGPPATAMSPLPMDGQNQVIPLTSLNWEDGMGCPATSYTLYFGTDNPPTNIANGITLTDTFYIPASGLDYYTQYFWRIDSHNEYGDAAGNVWNFSVIYPPDDGFESGDFSDNSWYFDGDADWTTDNNTKFEGLFSAKSGAITDSHTSTLKIDCTSSAFNSVSFWYKVSSEQDGDKLVFYIDGTQKEEWSGDIDWTYLKQAVPPGTHTLEWKYIKNEANAAGDDCAWVDDIYLPVDHAFLSVSAGDDATICEGSIYTTTANAENYSSLLWETSGDGTFENTTILNPVYTPGDNDIENGSLVLTITAENLQGNSISESMTLFINPAPFVSAGNDSTICQDIDFTLDAVAENYDSIAWTTTGDGTFNDSTLLAAVYTPGEQDIINGSINLTIFVNGISPCSDVSDEMILTIDPLPTTPEIPQGADTVDLVYVTTTSYTVNTANSATEYLWTLYPVEAGSLSVEMNNATILWSIDYLGDAYIKVKGINDCGESDFSDSLKVHIENTVGINNLSKAEKINLYPNPNTGIFKLIINDATRVESIKIYNSIGSLVFEDNKIASEYSKDINLSNLPNGVYYLTVNKENNNAAFKKIIIQK